jgi:hypothetical protein
MAVSTYGANDGGKWYREIQLYRSVSKDGGKTWQEPVSFPSGLNGASMRQGIVMSDGGWLFPLYWPDTTFDFDWAVDTSAEHPDEARYPFRSGVTVSYDGGRSFMRYGDIKGAKGLWEPNCIEVEKGHILMLMRNDAAPRLKRSDSFDYGKTWSEPFDTDIPNPNTKLTLFKTGGTIFLVNNFSDVMGWHNRKKLEIHKSVDGQVWEKVFAPEPEDAWFFYPHVCVCEKTRTVYLTYENSKRHYLVKLKFEELL